jgi:hypothetical membrane protein
MRPLILASALALVYIASSLGAFLRYPGEFSPFHNDTLSRLGNPHFNPAGAPLYNGGTVLSGLLASAVFLSLSPWKKTGTPAQTRRLRMVQGLGISASIAFAMLAVFPENQVGVHRFWSTVVFLGFGGGMMLAPVALTRGTQRPLAAFAAAALTGAVDAASFGFPETHWLEWATVALFLANALILGLYSRRFMPT